MIRRSTYCQRLMNPHPGISPAPILGYCSASPAVERQPVPTKALSNRGSVSSPPAPFRRAPDLSWPRPTNSVRRNLGQHPHRDESFTFSAKERDPETGLSYFGSRYYSSDLNVWLSVDPMAAKYPSLSPYTYCANNPVRVVDPDGEEIGEYRDWNGNLLGTDGNDDLNVFFVSDEESINTIRNNDISGKTTNHSDVKIDWETNKIVAHTIVSVYDMTVNNGGNREEAATFPGECRLPKFYPTGGDNGEIEIDSKGYMSIHSHKLNYFDCPDGTGTCVQTPYNLSDKDKAVFPNYNYNVVVGNSYQSVPNFSTGTVYEKRLGTAVIYDSGKNKVGEISINNLRKIKYF